MKTPSLPAPCTTRNLADQRTLTVFDWRSQEVSRPRPHYSSSSPPAPTPPIENPDALAGNLARALVEVRLGQRPLSGLRRWLQPSLIGALERENTASAPIVSAANARIRHTRVYRLTPRVAETSVLIEAAGRVHAVAMRLEHRRGRWGVTALQMT